MYNTPRKNGGRPSYRSPKTIPMKGLFKDGIWQCNCNPRLPAAHFQVKKAESANRGRWFYTCQEPKETGCGFFLWDTDAAPREIDSVLKNSRSEIQTGIQSLAANKDFVEGHVHINDTTTSAVNNKEDEDEFGVWPLTAEDEKDLVLADSAEVHNGPPVLPETPRKPPKIDINMGSGTKRKRDQDTLPTPQTGTDVFGSSARASFRTGLWAGDGKAGVMSPSVTPTPGRFREASEGGAQAVGADYDITVEIMDILKDADIEDETSLKLRQALNKHALRTSGIAKGRDISRLALKSKDIKIAELQQRISALETEREMDKLVIRNIKGDIARSVSSRGGRG